MAEITFTSKKQIGGESTYWQIVVTALNPIGPMQAVAADDASVAVVAVMNQRPAPESLMGSYRVRLVHGSSPTPTPAEADSLWRMIAHRSSWEG
jgi:hypothetical protein